MKSERKKIADRYRSAGMAENKLIKSQADRQYAEILARAKADAERIRGQAQAESITVLNKAHAQDPEFHRVLQQLDTYKLILNDRTTLVLSASSNLLKLLTEGIPDAAAPAQPAAQSDDNAATDDAVPTTSRVPEPEGVE
jgi:membrane protease subunit HflC